MNLRLTLSYDGTGFQGWAKQPGARTVEGALAAALDARYPGWSGLAVAGRTDTGVHALGQVASVHGRHRAARGQRRAGAERRAAARRGGAQLRSRCRTTSTPATRPAPAPTSTACGWCATRARSTPAGPSTTAARSTARCSQAWAEAVRGTHDFTAFTPTETQHRTFVRTVHHAAWHEVGEELRFSIAASSFLRHQVRTLVGTMLLAGRGEPCATPAELLAGAHRRQAGPTAPPHGLYLTGVRFAGEPEGVELVGIP